jgi:hypothetical protein
MPNLSFEGLGQQQPTAATGASVVSSRVTEQQPLVSPVSSSSSSSSSCIPTTSPAGSSTAGSQPSASSCGTETGSSKHELLFLSAGHSESTAASDQSVNARATATGTATSALPSVLLQVSATSPGQQPQQQQTSSSAEVNGVGPTETSASSSTSSSSSSSSDNLVDVVTHQQFDSISMDESISTATATSKPSVRTSSPSVVVKTTPISGRHNNKDLLCAEASGYLFRLADPSMMLVRPDSSPLSPSSTADREEETVGGGGSNSSTSSRLMASGVSNVSELLGAGMSPESVTDCGSLSKSSSDGDPVGVVSRKRPPTKLKSRRRNILSFPHHISVDELRLLQVNFFISSLVQLA